MATSPARYLVAAEPYYTDAHGTRHYYRHASAPGIGDLVEQDPDERDGVDAQGDRGVVFKGTAYDIAADVLVSVDKIIADRGVAPLADWERELLVGTTYHEVTLERPVVKPTALADVLVAHGMSGETAEVLTALAVLRSLED